MQSAMKQAALSQATEQTQVSHQRLRSGQPSFLQNSISQQNAPERFDTPRGIFHCNRIS